MGKQSRRLAEEKFDVSLVKNNNFFGKKMYINNLKRFIDYILATVLLLLLAPLLFFVFILVRSKLGSPAFFNQQRPGFKGKVFRIHKFRTMTDEKDEYGCLLPAVKRLTKFGRFLRGTSIDELPELWNVLKGEMSLVGPRPLRVEYLPLYSPKQARRHNVRPGITGWAQVQGRNTISWDEKFNLDVWYVDNQSFLLDAKILLMTVFKVFKREGVNQSETCTMTPFRGVTLNG